MKTGDRREVIERGLQSRLLRRLARHYGVRGKDGEKLSPISQPVLSRIVQGYRAPTPQQATMLERELNDLGFAISKFDMIFAFKKGQHLLELDKTRDNQ